VLLGEKGRWLSSATVAVQLGPLLPLLKQAILLCYAKTAGDPETLTGSKQRMAQKVYAILDSPSMMYKMQVAAILMNTVFKPVFDAIGRQNHTLFGGSEGIIDAYNASLAALDTMVQKIPGSKKQKERHVPSIDHFSGVQACVRLEGNDKDLA